MAAATNLADVLTLPHRPVKVTITANQWRVYELHPGALGLVVQGIATHDYGLFFFGTIDTDGPDDTDVSSGAGDYDLADVMQFAGHATVSNRQTVSIPMGRQFAASTGTTRARYVAISSASAMDVLVMQIGSDQ